MPLSDINVGDTIEHDLCMTVSGTIPFVIEGHTYLWVNHPSSSQVILIREDGLVVGREGHDVGSTMSYRADEEAEQ